MTQNPRSTTKNSIPDQLPDAPRSVCRRPGRTRWSGIAAPILFLGLIGITDGFVCYYGVRDILVSRYGTTVQGTIDKKSTYTSTSTRRRGRPTTTTHYRITFTYPVNEQNRTSHSDVEPGAYFRLKEGDKVQVRVLSSGNAALVNVPKPETSDLGFACFSVAFFLMMNYMAVMIAWGWIKLRAERRLVQRGTATAGTISRKEIESRRYFRLDYRYRVLADAGDGVEHTASVFVEKKDYDEAQIDQPVTVLYDPRHPHRSLLYRYGEYEIVGVARKPIPQIPRDVVAPVPTPITEKTSRWSAMESEFDLTQPDADRMILGPRNESFGLGFLLILGIVGIVLMLTVHWAFGCMALFYVCALAYRYSVRQWTFCLDTRKVTCGNIWSQREFRLRHVVAVQVCYGGIHHIPRGKGGPGLYYDTYQLNLVLDTDNEPRLNLTHHGDLAWTLLAGLRLARFLEVPFEDKHEAR